MRPRSGGLPRAHRRRPQAARRGWLAPAHEARPRPLRPLPRTGWRRDRPGPRAPAGPHPQRVSPPPCEEGSGGGMVQDQAVRCRPHHPHLRLRPARRKRGPTPGTGADRRRSRPGRAPTGRGGRPSGRPAPRPPPRPPVPRRGGRGQSGPAGGGRGRPAPGPPRRCRGRPPAAPPCRRRGARPSAPRSRRRRIQPAARSGPPGGPSAGSRPDPARRSAGRRRCPPACGGRGCRAVGGRAGAPASAPAPARRPRAARCRRTRGGPPRTGRRREAPRSRSDVARAWACRPTQRTFRRPRVPPAPSSRIRPGGCGAGGGAGSSGRRGGCGRR
ncbi:hypothetical protein MPOCJGCO_2102 [Methylobacterium trifolii]|uniref:Basic proline-rich protein n=1 Tax=Methylobacterium trifolii TaxID=1003092 RepID=A0ABQ4U125_9HYPH|nr:hypothetical protein MPOCJGCO_2102 [Methylobacterium trifolii]